MEYTYKEMRAFAVDFAYYIYGNDLCTLSHERYKQQFDEWIKHKLPQADVSGSAVEIIKWMADCPYSIDQATVPKNGIDAAPMQVVGNMSLSYVKYKQLCDVAEHYR